MQVRHFFILLFVSVSCMSGCASLPITVSTGSAISTRPLSSLSAPAVFAANETHKVVALVDTGLYFLSLHNGQRTRVDTRSPALLAWSPEGSRLAALLYDHTGGATVDIFTSDGARISTTALTEKIVAMLWQSEHELLLIANSYTGYSFGVSLQQNLVKLVDGVVTHKQSLHDTTIPPHYLKSIGLERLLGMITPRISPNRDEIMYTQLFNPPVFTPYLMLVVRNLVSSAEYAVARVELRARDAIFSADGETVLWLDEDGRLWQRIVWGSNEAQLAELSAQTTTETSVLIGGRVYRNGKQTASLPADALVEQLDNNRYLAAWHATLYLVQDDQRSGNKTTVLTATQREKLTTIRAWRSSGLITTSDYAEAKQRILTP